MKKTNEDMDIELVSLLQNDISSLEKLGDSLIDSMAKGTKLETEVRERLLEVEKIIEEKEY